MIPSNETVLITGGAGFIGSAITRTVLEAGYGVRVIDDLSTGSLDNLADISDEVDLREASILDNSALQSAISGVDVVFHEAAVPSVGRSIADPLRTHNADATGTLSVLIAARDAGSRLIYAASSSAYGGAATLPSKESLSTAPRSPYAVAKLAGEHYCRVFFENYGVPTIALRYFNVFGPRQDPASDYAAVIPRFITAVVDGKPPEIFGDGEQSRDFTFIRNVVHANLLAAKAGEAAWGSVINIAQGARTSLLQLLELIERIVGAPASSPKFGPERLGDVRNSQADISLAQELLGYQPMVSLEDGLRETVTWLTREAQVGG